MHLDRWERAPTSPANRGPVESAVLLPDRRTGSMARRAQSPRSKRGGMVLFGDPGELIEVELDATDGTTAEDVGLDHLVDVLRLDAPGPDVLGLDARHGPAGALAQTARPDRARHA